jgi:hypothetical protein
VIHRTFRSLDAPPKLLGFSVRQWAALIAQSSATLTILYFTHLPAKPAITLVVFLVGLPAALTYVSASGGLQLGGLVCDFLRWRLCRQSLAAVPSGFDDAPGLLVVSERDAQRPCAPTHRYPGEHAGAWDSTLAELVHGERWTR